MQSFSASGAPPTGPKNYVFVDEHNRHKRLKVMRACEGCRRRKIKCDAATTNSWPCAACKRLKLTCVPPVGGVDGEFSTTSGSDEQSDFQPQDVQHPTFQSAHHQYTSNFIPDSHNQYSNYTTYDIASDQDVYSTSDFGYHHLHPGSTHTNQPLYPQRYQSFDSASGQIGPQSATSPQSQESVTAEELAENLGDLIIDNTGVAAYINQPNLSTKEPPAPILDDDEDLPAFNTSAGSQIRIPPALLPSDEEASVAFQAYFKHVHPYVPVLCRGHFYQQWHHERTEISPLLLEAVLACAGQVSDDPAAGTQWLGLANRHEENFADFPRLSTVQALLLLLKARERAPKRGYYYRSWVTVKKIVSMARDLELQDHYTIHQSGGQCEFSAAECLTRTRVWQLALVCELMVGGPQGRYNFAVDIDTVDVSPNPPNSNIDEYERMISKQFSYWVRNVRNIRGYTETSFRLRKLNKKDWASDPKFVAYNEDFRKWPEDLPLDLKVEFPEDGSLPQVPSHFLANMHCHYQLGIVMLYKPQLSASKDFANDETWKRHMMLCYRSAKMVCALQEATIAQFDVLGLACMMRGLSFPIYAILSCVMVHLIAMTSPDPFFNQDAKNYFTRHMRVLEKCIEEWPMPEVEAQIYNLRAAFSVNLDRPFELRPSFPYGTPSEQSRSPSDRRPSELQKVNSHSEQAYYQTQVQQGQFFPTPPVSAGPHTKHPQHFFQDYSIDQGQHQFHQMQPTSHPNPTVTPTEAWNPTPIIDQFNTAFAIPQSALAPPPGSQGYGSSPPLNMPQQAIHSQISAQHFTPSPQSQNYTPTSFTPPQADQPSSSHSQTYIHPQNAGPPPQIQQAQPQAAHYFDSTIQQGTGQIPISQPYGAGIYKAQPENTAQPYVTPKEWQQSVASVYDPSGLKRKWDYEQQMALQQQGQSMSQFRRIG